MKEGQKKDCARKRRHKGSIGQRNSRKEELKDAVSNRCEGVLRTKGHENDINQEH